MTTTDFAGETRRDELARKVARVHGLRDPLGAKGFRVTRPRIDRETRARRGVFMVAFACFVACFGLVTMAGGDQETTAVSGSVAADRRSVVSAGTRDAVPTPHVRARATP